MGFDRGSVSFRLFFLSRSFGPALVERLEFLYRLSDGALSPAKSLS